MSELYPLLMTPLFDPRPWGRLDLSPIYSRRFEERIGESWLTGDNCKVQNGSLAGKSLAELASRYTRELVGEAPADGSRFPLLMKFLFPQEKLSVQVHPDDAAAQDLGEPCGKTECWYVAHADRGAKIGLGLKAGTSRAEFQQSVHDNRAEALLNWIPIAAGDMFYVAGGTVHTLGPGSIIVETQQQSDTTFRLYDYGRARELHLEHGLRVIKEQAASGKVKPAPFSKLGRNGNSLQPLVISRYFAVEKLELHAPQSFAAAAGTSSVQILVAVDGAGTLEAAGSAIDFAKGDGVVIPAAIREFTVRARPQTMFLKSYVPSLVVAEPEVTLS